MAIPVQMGSGAQASFMDKEMPDLGWWLSRSESGGQGVRLTEPHVQSHGDRRVASWVTQTTHSLEDRPSSYFVPLFKNMQELPKKLQYSHWLYYIEHMKLPFFFFVDQKWLVAIIYVVQPNAFLTVGILSKYFFFFCSPLSCCTLYYSSKTDNNKSNKEVQAKGKWIFF